MPFDGLRVLTLESRRAQEIATLISRQGGISFVAPSVKERALEDHSIAFHFLEQLEAGTFDLVICMTGVGLTFLRDIVITRFPVERLTEALQRVAIISRGPKPVPILRSMNVPIHVIVPEPNTWREVVDAVAQRAERRIAVQEYGRPNDEMTTALQALGAIVTPVALYRWEMPDNIEPLREAARKLASREFDVVLFTSSIQLDHLFEVARDLQLANEVRQSLKEHVVIASVGPVMTAALIAQGFRPRVIPEHPKMGALVKAAAEESAALITSIRASASQ